MVAVLNQPGNFPQIHPKHKIYHKRLLFKKHPKNKLKNEPKILNKIHPWVIEGYNVAHSRLYHNCTCTESSFSFLFSLILSRNWLLRVLNTAQPRAEMIKFGVWSAFSHQRKYLKKSAVKWEKFGKEHETWVSHILMFIHF